MNILFLAAIGSLITPEPLMDPPQPTLQGWGEVIDPDGDCRISLDKDRLTIAVPGTKHDLSAETGDMRAPRVLRTIEGEFIAHVKVAGKIGHAGQRLSDRFLAYHGAGLLLWVDNRTYVRLERAAIVQRNGELIHYANLELRRDGALRSSEGMKIPDRDYYLRLERRGGRVLGSVSEDGIRWAPFKPLTADLPKDVKLGVVATNTSTESLKAEFAEEGVFKKEVMPESR
jgi:regulation of enolase protein 1 (concanavalin A-like superfamily)